MLNIIMCLLTAMIVDHSITTEMEDSVDSIAIMAALIEEIVLIVVVMITVVMTVVVTVAMIVVTVVIVEECIPVIAVASMTEAATLMTVETSTTVVDQDSMADLMVLDKEVSKIDVEDFQIVEEGSSK